MLPLTFAEPGGRYFVQRTTGTAQVKKHLKDLGFCVGADVQVISSHNGDVIVGIKDSRLAVTKEMAAKIFV